MSKTAAADNVTVNEQMVDILSIGWKMLAKLLGDDWEEVKQALLADMVNLDKQDDPTSDHMVDMIAHHLQPYPEALEHMNEICETLMGHRMDALEVPDTVIDDYDDVADSEPYYDDDEDYVDDSAEVDDRGFEESGEAESGALEIEDDDGFFRVPVFFATNRKRDKRYKDDYRSFTGNRSNEMHYGVAQVSMPETHVPGELEGPGRIFDRTPDPKKHILVLSVDLMNKTTFLGEANKSLAAAKKDEALVYIHGYNVSFGGALRITAQVATDLGFEGIPITYSWPSMAKTLRYNADEANIKHGQDYFDEFLETITKELNVSKIHILAHSMGNRLATLGMRNLSEEAAKGKIGQVIFASPDVDRDVFAQRAKKFASKAERYTLYINESDLALELSKLIHGFARAGERNNDPLIVDLVDTIDATNIEGSLLGHSFYQKDQTVIGDIVELVLKNLAPISRSKLLQKGMGKIYWELTH